MTIRTQKPWQIYGIKECMVLTGRPLVEGGKVQPDPHEMVCADDAENASEYKFEMPLHTVYLDELHKLSLRMRMRRNGKCQSPARNPPRRILSA